MASRRSLSFSHLLVLNEYLSLLESVRRSVTNATTLWRFSSQQNISFLTETQADAAAWVAAIEQEVLKAHDLVRVYFARVSETTTATTGTTLIITPLINTLIQVGSKSKVQVFSRPQVVNTCSAPQTVALAHHIIFVQSCVFIFSCECALPLCSFLPVHVRCLCVLFLHACPTGN